ncbi:MAG: AAA family ATPase [Candidatus Levybacteria bacterium]|nr:AAA family ATPase [Candidatus Levybacteria bacterium]
MIYKKFTIKKFKGIDEVDIDLSNNRVITLVGLNESGKTTIMEAISLFYKMIKGDEPSESELKGFRPKGAGFTGNIEITGDLILQEEDRSKYIQTRTDLARLTLPVFARLIQEGYSMEELVS